MACRTLKAVRTVPAVDSISCVSVVQVAFSCLQQAIGHPLLHKTAHKAGSLAEPCHILRQDCKALIVGDKKAFLSMYATISAAGMRAFQLERSGGLLGKSDDVNAVPAVRSPTRLQLRCPHVDCSTHHCCLRRFSSVLVLPRTEEWRLHLNLAPTGGGGSSCSRGLRAGDARTSALRELPVPLLPPRP